MTDNNLLTQLGTSGPGTGSGFILPTREDPFALAQGFIGGLNDLQAKLYAQKQKAQQALGDIRFGGAWDIDMPSLAKKRQDFIDTIANYKKSGIDYTNPQNPEYAKVQLLKNDILDAYAASNQAKKYYDITAGHYDTNPKLYNDKIRKELEGYRNTPLDDRMKLKSPPLLSPKEDYFDTATWGKFAEDIGKPDITGGTRVDKNAGLIINTENEGYSNDRIRKHAKDAANWIDPKTGLKARGYLMDSFQSLPEQDQQYYISKANSDYNGDIASALAEDYVRTKAGSKSVSKGSGMNEDLMKLYGIGQDEGKIGDWVLQTAKGIQSGESLNRELIAGKKNPQAPEGSRFKMGEALVGQQLGEFTDQKGKQIDNTIHAFKNVNGQLYINDDIAQNAAQDTGEKDEHGNPVFKKTYPTNWRPVNDMWNEFIVPYVNSNFKAKSYEILSKLRPKYEKEFNKNTTGLFDESKQQKTTGLF